MIDEPQADSSSPSNPTRLTLLNLTSEAIFCFGGRTGSLPASNLAVLPSSTTTLDSPNGERLCFELSTSIGALEEKPTINPNGLIVPVTVTFDVSWKVIPVPAGCPWRIYSSEISRKQHRLFIFPRRDLSAFLSEIPDTIPLSSLLLPGSHDSMAFYGWPISQCQTTPLDVQLQSGIRALDIRLAVIESRLIAYHGIYPQRTPFQEILSTIHSFLTTPSTSRETIVMSVKQEDFEQTPPETFSRLVHEEIFFSSGGREMWFLENRIPYLGEARGKVAMLSRFGGNGDGWEGGLEGLGIHPTTWPDSQKAGFSWQCKNTLVRTHDWYNIPSFLSIPEKVSLATSVLLPPPNNPPMPTLNVTFLSAASIPLALPPIVARGFGWPKWGLGIEGVNSRVSKWLLDLHSASSESYTMKNEKNARKCQEPHIRGWVLMDFYEDPENSVVPLLVECNFRDRCSGEEGW